jgi:hypothetical protein
VPTPQTFSTASPRSGFTNPEEFSTIATAEMRHSRPRSARFEPSSVERLYNTSSSRTPLDPCSSGPRHLAVLTHPGFVGAAPTLADTSRLRLPPASAGCCDSPQVQVFHLHSNSSASWRTKPALNAFAITELYYRGSWLISGPAEHCGTCAAGASRPTSTQGNARGPPAATPRRSSSWRLRCGN